MNKFLIALGNLRESRHFEEHKERQQMVTTDPVGAGAGLGDQAGHLLSLPLFPLPLESCILPSTPARAQPRTLGNTAEAQTGSYSPYSLCPLALHPSPGPGAQPSTASGPSMLLPGLFILAHTPLSKDTCWLVFTHKTPLKPCSLLATIHFCNSPSWLNLLKCLIAAPHSHPAPFSPLQGDCGHQ